MRPAEDTLWLRKSQPRVAQILISNENHDGRIWVRYGDLREGVYFFYSRPTEFMVRGRKTLTRWTNRERFLKDYVEVDPHEVNALAENLKALRPRDRYAFQQAWIDERIAS